MVKPFELLIIVFKEIIGSVESSLIFPESDGFIKLVVIEVVLILDC